MKFINTDGDTECRVLIRIAAVVGNEVGIVRVFPAIYCTSDVVIALNLWCLRDGLHSDCAGINICCHTVNHHIEDYLCICLTLHRTNAIYRTEIIAEDFARHLAFCIGIYSGTIKFHYSLHNREAIGQIA